MPAHISPHPVANPVLDPPLQVFQAASQNSGATVSMLLQIAERKGLPLSTAALTEIAGLFRRQGAVGAAWEVARKLKAQEPALDRVRTLLRLPSHYCCNFICHLQLFDFDVPHSILEGIS